MEHRTCIREQLRKEYGFHTRKGYWKAILLLQQAALKEMYHLVVVDVFTMRILRCGDCTMYMDHNVPLLYYISTLLWASGNHDPESTAHLPFQSYMTPYFLYCYLLLPAWEKTHQILTYISDGAFDDDVAERHFAVNGRMARPTIYDYISNWTTECLRPRPEWTELSDITITNCQQIHFSHAVMKQKFCRAHELNSISCSFAAEYKSIQNS